MALWREPELHFRWLGEENVCARGLPMRACSACAGDYEDPDRTAWAADDPEDEQGEDAAAVPTEEIPDEG